jgi:putative transposase
MSTPERRTEFEGRLIFAMQEIGAELAGWVILSNYYYLLAGISALDQVSAALKRLHGSTSFEWNKADGLARKRRVWYKFSDRFIRDEQQYYCALSIFSINRGVGCFGRAKPAQNTPRPPSF